MKYFIVKREEYSGYECDGHNQTYIVAANSTQEAFNLLDDRTEVEKLEGWTWDCPSSVEGMKLPDLKRMKKSRIIY